MNDFGHALDSLPKYVKISSETWSENKDNFDAISGYKEPTEYQGWMYGYTDSGLIEYLGWNELDELNLSDLYEPGYFPTSKGQLLRVHLFHDNQVVVNIELAKKIFVTIFKEEYQNAGIWDSLPVGAKSITNPYLV